MKSLFTINSKNLTKALKTVVFATVTKPAGYISQIYFTTEDNKLRLTATDATRLSTTITNCNVVSNFEFLIEKKDVLLLLKKINNLNSDINSDITCIQNGLEIIFETNGLEIKKCHTTEYIWYPNYKTLFTFEPIYTVTISKKQLKTAINDAYKAQKKIDVRDYHCTILSIADNKITLKNLKKYPYECTLNAKTTSNITVAINPKYLIDILRVIESNTVTLQIDSIYNLIKIEDNNSIHIFMPLKQDE